MVNTRVEEKKRGQGLGEGGRGHGTNLARTQKKKISKGGKKAIIWLSERGRVPLMTGGRKKFLLSLPKGGGRGVIHRG